MDDYFRASSLMAKVISKTCGAAADSPEWGLSGSLKWRFCRSVSGTLYRAVLADLGLSNFVLEPAVGSHESQMLKEAMSVLACLIRGEAMPGIGVSCVAAMGSFA